MARGRSAGRIQHEFPDLGMSDMQDVPSANLVSVGYDEQDETMDVAFHYRHELYRFFSISRDLFETMMGTINSPGKFFYHEIRSVYPYVRLR